MEQYQIISTWDEEEKYEYDIFVDVTDAGTEYRMYRSSNETWSENHRGELLIQATDDGNDLIFKHAFKKKLDYAEMSELYIFMNFMNQVDQMYKGEIYHVKKIGTL